MPAIVTTGVGAAEIVRDAGGGLVVDGDPAALAAAIDRLTGDADLARRLGEAGRRHVRERLGWATVAAQMEGLYESLRR